MDKSSDTASNLCGRLYQHYHGAGLRTITKYDLNGNAVNYEERYITDATLTDVGWEDTLPNAMPPLNAETFFFAEAYDALNRQVSVTYPGAYAVHHAYDAGGRLNNVKLKTGSTLIQEYVTDILYNARGQRSYISYGNGSYTSYSYYPDTFRLKQQVTAKASNTCQDLKYWYDPVGNITRLKDDAQRTLYFNNSATLPVQDYTYDPLYRLITATGRELVGTATFGSSDNYNDSDWISNHKGDDGSTQNYIQKYSYDAVGNILELQHIADAGSYTRGYNYNSYSNRLKSTEVDTDTYKYRYDVFGNITAMPHLAAIGYRL